MATYSNFHTDDPQVSGATVHNLVATANWRPKFAKIWPRSQSENKEGGGGGGALNLMWFKTFFFPRASRPPLGPSSFLCSMYRGKVARGETLGLHLVPRLNVPTAKSSFIHSYLGWFLKKICFA